MEKIAITKNNYERAIKDTPRLLLKFGAVWCGPCKMLEASLEGALNGNTKITVGSVDVQEEPELAEQFNVRNLPKLMLFENGNLVNEKTGTLNLAQLKEFLSLG